MLLIHNFNKLMLANCKVCRLVLIFNNKELFSNKICNFNSNSSSCCNSSIINNCSCSSSNLIKVNNN
jgi:hypothetical protein